MLENLENKINEILEARVNECLEIIKKEIDDNTPEDIKTLLGNNKIEKAKLIGNEIVGKVVNNTDYVLYVEFGVPRAKKYHKPKGVVFMETGDYKGLRGARMFTKGFDFSQERVKKILSKSFIGTSLKFQK